ncbi:MAG: 2-C-methyl-D-erythritol 4-phosphate cytidylyltransferase [Endomicrobiales bacterium]|nr:2-C-methyl-D-erythritol 4-phosphate cytidylyltransferase [Endomicrobiales bacterium]
MQKAAVIIVAGGKGRRFGSRIPKQFVELHGRPLFSWSIDAFRATRKFSQIILVVPGEWKKKLRQNGELKDVDITTGGRERHDSVRNGLRVVKPDIGLVAVHDAVRPLVRPGHILKTLKAASSRGASALAVPAGDTVKLADASYAVKATVPRDTVWLAQTPQIFRKEIIKTVYFRGNLAGVTDDAQAAELAGFNVRLVRGSRDNLKITEPNDLKIAESLLKGKRVFVGFGYDVHRFSENRPLILGGVKIPHDRGLAGHSDADAILHALMDAMLGAAGLDDIGHYFPNTSRKFKNASSIALLEKVVREIKKYGLSLVNADLTVVAETPRISPHIVKMKKKISAVTGLSAGRIGIKATTNERIGFIGRNEGIAALAACLLSNNK